MLRNRYNRTDLFALVPQLGLRFEPQLEQLDRLLDDDELLERVRDDLARRYPTTRSRGRPSTPVEVILRMLVVMRLYSWSYEQCEYFVNDSLGLPRVGRAEGLVSGSRRDRRRRVGPGRRASPGRDATEEPVAP